MTSNHLTISPKRVSNIARHAISHHHDNHANHQEILAKFIPIYYQHLPTEMADRFSDETLSGMALHHFSLLKTHNGTSPNISVINPLGESHLFNSERTIIALVAIDRPFLTDTLLMSLERQGIGVHRIYNNIIKVERTDGHISDIQAVDESSGRANSCFALVHIEIDRQSDDKLADIKEMLLKKIHTIDVIVGDFGAMADKLDEIKEELKSLPIPTEHYTKEAVTGFLEWVGRDNFIFMGYREYRFENDNGTPELYSVGGSGLGVLQGKETDELSKSFHGLPTHLKHLIAEPRVLLLSKSARLSPIHRPAYLDFLGIQKYNDQGELIGEYRFVGLLTSRAYQTSVANIPLLNEKAGKILAMSRLPKNSHAYLKLAHIVNTLPRDDLFQASTDELYPMVASIASLQDKNRLRLLVRTDHYQRFVSCLVYVPLSKFNSDLRQKIQDILTQAFGGVSSSFTTEFNELHHARVHIHVRTETGKVKDYDPAKLERELSALMHDWTDEYAKALTAQTGESRAREILATLGASIPLTYRERFDVHTAVADTTKLLSLDDDKPKIWHLYQSAGERVDSLTLKLYGRGEILTLSHVLPILEHFGVAVISASTYDFGGQDTPDVSDDLWLQEYKLTLKAGLTVDLTAVKMQVEHALDEIWQGRVESDRLNQLILTTDIDTYDVVVLRALSRYIVQARAPFSTDYIHSTLVGNPAIASLLVKLFHAKMSPTEQTDTAPILAQIDSELSLVTSLDEDRIVRWFLDLLNAMLRTNFYQTDKDGARKDRLSFKFKASDIPNLPKPKPMFEIYVYSPRVEGVHLRGGKVARGGLRWSDRMEDYRTEVLGLVKAQMVKNSVIVPVGSKGGFVCKDKSKQTSREAWQAEGVACYQTYIRGLLDLTDNLVDGNVVPPANTVRHDEDDPYLVVAADKGTATFSDIANALSAEYNFWLQDAFASGGSAGYDHKGMGITARGAWESVKRHFRLMGKDIQARNEFTVVGIGDMSGDVFGNGMLLSKNIRLVAAFNHLHIFIDPNPDAKASFEERERLFNLPRSAWTDYKAELISEGGGVFNRTDKAIAITPQMKERFDIAEDSLTPNELLNKLLKAPVDLIWNGGIGTYIKSSDEDHSDVGDRANDAIRVDGREVRAKVVGEGGNLGCTQRGRIEYALNGGRIYTDAIDNSGGVNCSDHEVNIKILLGSVTERGDMTIKQRNDLLASMTDTVANLVLRQNYLQPQTIELSAYQAPERAGEHIRFMNFLEKAGRLDRAIEYLPSDDTLTKRKAKDGRGLTNPELAVLLSYGKMWVYDELLGSGLTEDAYFLHELKKYFPNTLGEQFFDEMTRHRLHREIICTYLTNGLVNRLGIENVFAMSDETGHSVADITRSYAIVRDVFDVQAVWDRLSGLDNAVAGNTQIELELTIQDVLKQGMTWFLNRQLTDESVAQTALTFKNLVADLFSYDVIDEHFGAYIAKDVADLTAKGLSDDDAHAFARLPIYVHALDVVALADQKGVAVTDVAQAYFGVFSQLHMDKLTSAVADLPAESYWDRKASYALTGEFNRTLMALITDVLAVGGLSAWQDKHRERLAVLSEQIDGLSDKVGLAELSVLLSEVNGLKMV
ncbi:glutamate dehydrogenase [Moraxella lacunata]|uniref:NAD-glutamate dehydrogenase n=1 Tax=Moraxella lacunata TaxID=477 RepID=UPI000803911F|nr:NAD-glutamate dehydrogenase [Moraxella lacunata]OBX57810.1 glutamate dehydrogenase [Moraxella lacunata]